MARHASTYRGARRNACIGVWPRDGVQINPVYLTPTDIYKHKPEGSVVKMVRNSTGKMVEKVSNTVRRLAPKK